MAVHGLSLYAAIKYINHKFPATEEEVKDMDKISNCIKDNINEINQEGTREIKETDE